MRLHSRHVPRIAAVLFTFCSAFPALAQPQPPAPPQKIGEVTLFGEEQLKVEAATKTEIPISKAPSAVTVITARQIEQTGARTVADLLRLVAGVNVRWNPMIQTVDIRGFGENPFSNRILLLIDGSPTNSGDTGGFPLSPGFEYFPIQNIKRIEIVRGPGSSLYGENAYWGVINIVTLSGEDLSGGDAQIYGGGLNTLSGTLQYGLKKGDTSILGSLRLMNSQMPQQFWLDDNSKYKASDVFVKAAHKDLQLSIYRHDDRLDGFEEELPTAELGFPPGSEFASAHQVKQTLDIVSLKYNHAPADARVTFGADVSYAHRYGMHCAGCHAAHESPLFSREANHGYQAIGDFRMGLHMIPGHDVLVGLEARRLDRADHKQELSDDAGVVSGYNKIALYAQDQFDIVRDLLRVVAGLRWDQKTSLFASKTSPRLSLIYTPNPRLVVRGGYSTAFRFPTFSELYQASWFLTVSNDQLPIPAFPIAVFAPNPNLKPEEISMFELGGEYQISPTVSAKLDLYRSKVHNFIVIVQHQAPIPNPSTIGWENQTADARITGGELELRSNFTNSLTGFVNWAHQTESQINQGIDSNGNPFEFVYAPRNKVNVGAYGGPYHNVRASLEASWRGSYVAPRDWYFIRSNFTDPTVHPLPSYTLLNARVSYDLPFATAGARPLRVTVFGNNLLDKRVEETLIGSQNRIAGREMYAQLEAHF